jgi:hypothetical protein
MPRTAPTTLPNATMTEAIANEIRKTSISLGPIARHHSRLSLLGRQETARVGSVTADHSNDRVFSPSREARGPLSRFPHYTCRMTPPISRRDAMIRSLALGATFLLPASALIACKKDLVCTDTSGLSADEIATRNTLKYVDQSMDQTKLCSGCQQFKPSPMSGTCGACAVVKGPIHPNGGCTAWAKKVS